MRKAICSESAVGALGPSERPAFARLYAVAGRSISVTSSDPDADEIFNYYFDGWHFDFASDGAGNSHADASICITSSQRPPAPPDHIEPFQVADNGICRTDSQTYLFEAHGSVIRVTNSFPARIDVWIGDNPAAWKPEPIARLVFHALTTALRRCHLFQLHAAGLVAPHGEGILIVGPSGTAKSTLATQLAAAGWCYLSDDTLLIQLSNQVARAHAFRRVFALTDRPFLSSVITDSHAICAGPVPFDPLKRQFEPQALFPDRFVKTCTPQILFFSRIISGARSQALSLSQGETMARLIRMCPWAAYDRTSAKAHLQALAQLARQSRGFELLVGEDLRDDVDYANQFFLNLTERT